MSFRFLEITFFSRGIVRITVLLGKGLRWDSVLVRF